MTFVYATGLRLSESLNIKITDIDGNRKQIRVSKGKGSKDRYITIPDCLLELLRNYWRRYRPKVYLFNGLKTGSRFSNRAAQCGMIRAKRAQWQDRLGGKLLAVPYMHTVFAIPHELNKIGKRYPKQIYNLLLRSAWETVKQLCKDSSNVGALPGMISVLHTFGSDMKYHLHAHCLITFGGIKNNKWVWPKRKKKIAPYRMICRKFREIFISGLDNEINTGSIVVPDYEEIREELWKPSWNVRNTYPTMQTGLIENYLVSSLHKSGGDLKK